MGDLFKDGGTKSGRRWAYGRERADAYLKKTLGKNLGGKECGGHPTAPCRRVGSGSGHPHPSAGGGWSAPAQILQGWIFLEISIPMYGTVRKQDWQIHNNGFANPAYEPYLTWECLSGERSSPEELGGGTPPPCRWVGREPGDLPAPTQPLCVFQSHFRTAPCIRRCWVGHLGRGTPTVGVLVEQRHC